jgi:predicted component of type VI protein secretion system
MNKCTLLVDGNWILQSRVSVLFDKFEKQNPLPVKQAAADELKELIARSIHNILNRFCEIRFA